MNQIEKNTVPSKNQLQSSSVTFVNSCGKGIKVMFVGNSITKHGIKEEIGWYGTWGMAASDENKDYVHLLIQKINETNPGASYCICQAANWERNYKNGSEYLNEYEQAKNFESDLIIFRLVENCPQEDFDKDIFYLEYQNLIDYLNGSRRAKIILTTSFWKHVGDDVILKVAKERNYPYAYLGELGEDDAMKAIGLFEHSGVANHPGDLGMEKIAGHIFDKIKEVL